MKKLSYVVFAIAVILSYITVGRGCYEYARIPYIVLAAGSSAPADLGFWITLYVYGFVTLFFAGLGFLFYWLSTRRGRKGRKMFENFYTTRMSAKGRTLQTRFMKMRLGKMKQHRLLGIITALILAAMLAAAIIFTAAFANKQYYVKVYHNNRELALNAPPIVVNNTVYFPVDELIYTPEMLPGGTVTEYTNDGMFGLLGFKFTVSFPDNTSYKIQNGKKYILKLEYNSEGETEQKISLQKKPFMKNTNIYVTSDYIDCLADRFSFEVFDNKGRLVQSISRPVPKLTEPPENGSFMVIQELSKNYGIIQKYIPISDEEYSSCKNDADVLSEKKPALYGVTMYKDIEEYEHCEIPSPPSRSLIELAKAKADYTIVTPADIHDIIQADFRVTFDGETKEETLTNSGELKRLEKILQNAEKGALGVCPYSGEMTLARADGKNIMIHFAADSCSNMIFGTNGSYTISEKEKMLIWRMFPQIYESERRAR